MTRFVLTWLSTAAGGAERSVAELASALADSGHEVVLVWWDATGTDAATVVDRRVIVRRVADLTCYRATLRAALDSSIASVMIGTHRTMHVDVVMARCHAVPVIVVVRALLLTTGRLRILNDMSGQLSGCTPDEMNWNLLAATDCWVGVSAAATRCLLAQAPQGARVEQIYNGVRIAVERTSRQTHRVRRIGVAARAEPWKRIDRLLSAVAALPEHLLIQMSLHIFGEGPELIKLQQQARRLGLADRTTCHGHIGWEWTRQCDVLVSTCEIEAFGRVVVEAGAAGVPQIVPDQGGTAELVVPGMTGLRYDVNNPAALTRALTMVAAWGTADYHRYSAAALAHARRFSLTTCAAAYARLGADLLTYRSEENAIYGLTVGRTGAIRSRT